MVVHYVFYGYSGNQRLPTPAFPNGNDRDKSFQIVAETLGVTLQKLNPADRVLVMQAWSKDVIVSTLESSAELIGQVHVAAHGDSTRLSLNYHFDRGSQLLALAQKWNADPGTDTARAIGALREEHGLVTGYFTRGIEPPRLVAIKANLTSNTTFQIWGCFSGHENEVFTGWGDPEIDPYLQRFNFGNPQVDGLARDIAIGLGISCTAAVNGWGLSFWHGTPGKRVKKNDRKVLAQQPFWLWNTKKSDWVTYDSSGLRTPKPSIFGVFRDRTELPRPKPPRWLTSIFWS